MLTINNPDMTTMKAFADMLISHLPGEGSLPKDLENLLGPQYHDLFQNAIDNWVAYEQSRDIFIGDDRKTIEAMIGDELSRAYKDIAHTYNNSDVNILNQENLRLSKVYSKAYQSTINRYTGALSPLQKQEAVKQAIIQTLIIEVDRGVTEYLISQLIKQDKLKKAIAYFKSLKNARLAQAAISAMAAIDLELIQRAQRDALMDAINQALKAENKYIKSLQEDLSVDMAKIRANINACEDRLAWLEHTEHTLQTKLDDIGEQLQRMAFQSENLRKEKKQIQSEVKQVRREIGDVNKTHEAFEADARDLDKQAKQVESLVAQRLKQGIDDAAPPGDSGRISLEEQQRLMAEIKAIEAKMLEVEPARKGFQDLKAQLELMFQQNNISAQQIMDYAVRAQRLADNYPEVKAFQSYHQQVQAMLVASVNKPSTMKQLKAMGLLAPDTQSLDLEASIRLMDKFKTLSEAALLLERDFAVEEDEHGQFVIKSLEGGPQDPEQWLNEQLFDNYHQNNASDKLPMDAQVFIERHLQARQLAKEGAQSNDLYGTQDFNIRRSTFDNLYNMALVNLGMDRNNPRAEEQILQKPWLELHQLMKQDEASFYQFKRAYENKNESLALLVQKQIEAEIEQVYQSYDERMSQLNQQLSEAGARLVSIDSQLSQVDMQSTGLAQTQASLLEAKALVLDAKRSEQALKGMYEKELAIAQDIQDLYEDLKNTNNQIIDYQDQIKKTTNPARLQVLERNLESVCQKKRDITSNINRLVKAKNVLGEDIKQAKALQADWQAKLAAYDLHMPNKQANALAKEPVNQAIYRVLKETAQDFHPSQGLESSNQRVKHLVATASDKIIQSGIMDNISQSQKQKVYDYLESPELTQKVYEIALKARVDYYYPIMVQNFHKLAAPDGLDWLQYPRARRDVIDGLIERLNQVGRLSPGEKTQIRDYLCQEKFKALQEDLTEIHTTEELSSLGARIDNGQALQHLPGFMQEQVKEALQAKRETLAVTQPKSQRPLIYSAAHSPEQNLTHGIKVNLQAQERAEQEKPDARSKATRGNG